MTVLTALIKIHFKCNICQVDMDMEDGDLDENLSEQERKHENIIVPPVGVDAPDGIRQLFVFYTSHNSDFM